jgi:hypothetical protein
VSALWYLPYDSSGPASNDAEAGNHHVGRDHRPIQYSHAVLDDGELSNHAALTDMDVTANERRLDDRTWTEVDVVAYLERVMREDSARWMSPDVHVEGLILHWLTLCTASPVAGEHSPCS